MEGLAHCVREVCGVLVAFPSGEMENGIISPAGYSIWSTPRSVLIKISAIRHQHRRQPSITDLGDGPDSPPECLVHERDCL